MRLKYQLFITLLVANALLIAVMFIVSSLTFSRGFLGYINQSDEQRLYAMVQSLEAQYAIDGSWDHTVSNPGVIRSLLRSSGVEARGNRGLGRPPRNRANAQPGDRVFGRLVLADANKQVLLGRFNRKGNPDWKTLKHNDEVVGYLGLNKLTRLNNQFDQAFERQQKKTFALAGLSMILLSALLAAPLASRIVRPILQVSKTVGQISNGNYAHRVKTKRQDEIGELAVDINKLGQTLEKNRGARQRHFAEISHELRTPVAVLQAELEALQDGVRDLNQGSVDSLHTETIKLKGLIDDLHILSLADAGALDYQMQPLNLSELVQTQVRKINTKDAEITVHLTVPDDPIFISGDLQRLTQLLDNLTQNTLRYTNTPGSLHLSLLNSKDHVTLIWADSAPGVSDAALSKLFEPLFRAEKSRDRKQGGSGLGLTIVEKIIDAHNGTCTSNHSSHGGLEIQINFPNTGNV